MNPLETYLRNLRDIRSSGAAVKETSYYGALESLFNEIGKTLKPKVRCIISLKNQGGGLPDGGLFTANQFQRSSDAEPLDPQNPERGVIEVKGTQDDVWEISKTEQVSKYWQKYRQVLVTNYRDFLLIGQDENGKAIELESYRLASSETDFWAKVANPSQFAQQEGDRFLEYLKRVMLSAAPIAAPEDVAWFLASYARDAKFRIENTDIPALANVRTALEEALGVKFEGEKGDRFFRSTLVQTLFYSIFSAWVLWHKENPNRQDKFDWRTAAYYLHVPMIQALFYQISDPRKLKALGLVEVLEWTGTSLNRVSVEEFFAKFEEGQAVQYFYEPFLQAFDPELRKELGVWYTPPEVVKYMVSRVDTVLKEELGIEDGLADPNVYILDPCCGTGAYLVEVLKQIAETLKDKGEDALGSYEVKEAAIKRVFGFEILTAPFVVAHLQLGLILQNLGVPLVDEKERVGVYLTNALTGWEPPDEDGKKQIKQLEFNFPELKQERDAADEVKREKPILVILGNPPYNAFAGVSPKEEQGLVETYKEGLISEWGIKKFNLDDLYIRFLRLAEQRIAEKTNKGVVCYISNFSYLGDPSFVVMRQRFLSEFDKLWFDCMNGDSRETGKLTPEGKPDPSVFSTEYNREGIRVGTAIALLVRQEKRTDKPLVRFRHFWGVNKRIDLLDSLNSQDFDAEYELAKPDRNSRYSFRPSNVGSHYLEWPKLVDLCGSEPFNGPVERRGNSLIVFASEKADLEILSVYLDVDKSDNEIREIAPRWMKSSGEFKAEATRAKLKGKISYDSSKIVPYPFKPFDLRLAYLDADIQPLFSRPSPDLLAMQKIPQNCFVITRDTADRNFEGSPFYFSRLVCDYDCISGHARHFPILLRPKQTKTSRKVTKQNTLFDVDAILNTTPTANISTNTRTYLSQLGITNPDANADTAGLIWMHALAIGYSPTYLTENADGIRDNWPRIPLPNYKGLLLESAELGKKIAALLDTENPVIGVTSGKIRLELKAIAIISRTGGGQLNPDTGDLAITAGWGYSGQNNVTMPGKGKIITRPYTPEEIAGIEEGAKAQGLSSEIVLNLLGKNTCDIYLNELAFWKNIPINVWEYTIGGYQVIKKWLSYREEKLLGRSLTKDEVREVMNMARRIAAILLLQSSLDENYQNIKQASYKWK
ncbi:type ISP restriction/modification enzyme [Aerosakkonema funiforme]|uniref:site-specific DNA-methyltransferase (adenine-specific) n=1 Tax=Aerosakkonema funiforme FACHB-1375 TaxID=2949571 RepID=A0A926VER9_9CYAN|nr:type ISP restriction/modification enzyme [Aerosakkonema funiforme]MBD2182621.1 N-6 DNA methylase [Aerosakkonema funiforme FACHB-1375]